MTCVAEVEGITEYRLDNGLRVLLFPDSSTQSMTVNVTYLVGSRHETHGETGMAHLLEHLLFKGSVNHPQVTAELNQHGARANGTTWFDRTNYHETFPATEDNLKWALDMEADRMVNSLIAKMDLDSELTVVRNEYERGDGNPGNVLEQRMLSTAYQWHNYGHATLGTQSDIENASIDRLRAFYQSYYQPDNAVLLISGKFDADTALMLIKQNFGAIQKPVRALPSLNTVEPAQDGEREVILRRTGDVQITGVAYHVPNGAHADFAALDILNEILSYKPGGRLYRTLMATGRAANIQGYSYQLHDPGTLLAFAEVRQGNSLVRARDTLIDTMEGMGNAPPGTEELEHARTRLLNRIELQLNKPDELGLTLSEWMGMGDWRLFFMHRDRLRKVTATDVQRVAREYLKPGNRTSGLFIPTENPDRATIPAGPDLAALLKDYKGDTAKVQGESFDPSPANIDARMQASVGRSGLKLALLPKRTRGRKVTAVLTLHFGSERSLRHRVTAADVVGDMLMRGTRTHTRQQLTALFDQLQARVAVSSSAANITARIEATHEHFPAVMTLVAEMLREPAFNAREFELLRQEKLSSIERERSDPQALASIAMQKALNPYPEGDVRHVSGLPEKAAALTAVTLDQVRDFHRDFYGATHGELAVVGDIDPAAVRNQIDKLFAGWRSHEPYVRVPLPFRHIEPVAQQILTPNKANAAYFAALPLQISDQHPDYPSLVLANYMLGGGFLNSRLEVRIRQQEGLSYSSGSVLLTDSHDDMSALVIYAIYSPQNIDRLETAVHDVLQQVLYQGFTEKEVTAAKQGWQKSQQLGRASDDELSAKLANYQYLGRTPMWDADLEQKILALTPEQLQQALKRHLDPTRLSVFTAGDFQRQ